MSNALPLALRERVIRAYVAGQRHKTALARRFDVSYSSVKRWIAQYEQQGRVAPLPDTGGAPPKVLEEHKRALF